MLLITSNHDIRVAIMVSGDAGSSDCGIRNLALQGENVHVSRVEHDKAAYRDS